MVQSGSKNKHFFRTTLRHIEPHFVVECGEMLSDQKNLSFEQTFLYSNFNFMF